MAPEAPKEAPWQHAWMFSDSHDNEYIEQAMTRAPKEIGCAFTASFLVSPMVSIIDKCIVQSQGNFMGAIKDASIDMIKQPKAFFGSLAFRLTFLVYFGTYATANMSELVLDMKKVHDDEQRKQSKVAASAVANIGLLAWRDSVFAKAFGGAEAAKKKTPMRTIGLFAARDTATMYATFYAAPSAAKYLIRERGWERNTAELSMALAIPVVAQIVTAPWHIHAMDYFNNREATTAQRIEALKKEFPSVSFARGLRILPAFGIGSFSNNKFRELFIRGHDENKLIGRRMTAMIDTARRMTRSAPSRKMTRSINSRN